MSPRFATIFTILFCCAPLLAAPQHTAPPQDNPAVASPTFGTPAPREPALQPSNLRLAGDSLLLPRAVRSRSFTLEPIPAFPPSANVISRACGPSNGFSSSPSSIMSTATCDPKQLSPGGKFVLATKRIFYPLPLLYSAAGAGISQARDSDPGFGQGARGFGRRFGDRIGTRGIKELTGTFLLASAFKMDPQYHPSSRKGFGNRLGSVLTQVFVSQTDSGRRQFNFPSVVGAAVGVGVSNAWRAERDRKASDSAIRFALSFALDAASNFFNEFIVCRKHPRS